MPFLQNGEARHTCESLASGAPPPSPYRTHRSSSGAIGNVCALINSSSDVGETRMAQSSGPRNIFGDDLCTFKDDNQSDTNVAPPSYLTTTPRVSVSPWRECEFTPAPVLQERSLIPVQSSAMTDNPAGFPEVAMLDDIEESVGRILDIPITKHDAVLPSQPVLPVPPSNATTQFVSTPPSNAVPTQSAGAAPGALSNAPVDPPTSTTSLQTSTTRRTTRQLTQQLSEKHTAPGTRSEESIIAAFNASVSEADLSAAGAPLSTPTSKAKGKGKEKENALASSSKTASPRKSTTSKSDDANTVARLAAISARVEGVNNDLTDELDGLRAQVTAIATEVAEFIATSNSRLTNVITSNNQVAHAVTALRAQAAAMMDELRERRNQEAELRQSIHILTQQVQTRVDAANSTNHADLVPAVTRPRTSLEPSSTLVSAPPASTVDAWATTLQANTVATVVPSAVAAPAPLPMSGQGPATGTNTPPVSFHAPAAAAPSYPAAPAPTSATHHAGGNGLVRAPQPQRPSNVRSSGAQVLIGPMAWSTDITGQARTILVNTPGCQHLHWRVIARAARAGPNYIVAIFQEDQGDAAVQFVNSFTAAVEYYPSATVTLLQGNA